MITRVLISVKFFYFKVISMQEKFKTLFSPLRCNTNPKKRSQGVSGPHKVIFLLKINPKWYIFYLMSELDFLCGEITRRYGNITRARGPFLYTEKNVRLTDLFQENGKAILGWGGNSALTIFKNVLNRGISGSYDTAFNYRIQKASSDLLGDQRTVLLFSDKKSALDSALSVCPDKTSI